MEIETPKKSADAVEITGTVKDANQIIDKHSDQINNIQSSIEVINAKLQASVDLTDDLVGMAGNVLAHADTVLTFYLGGLSLLSVVFATAITWWINKSRDQHIKEAIDKVLNGFAEDVQLQDDFVKKLVAHPNIGKNINTAIDQIYKETLESHKQKLKEGVLDIIDNIDK